MTHNEYWEHVKHSAHERLNHLFSECTTKISDLVGDDNGIDTYHDAKVVLAFVFRSHATPSEKACAILSTCEALQAMHELAEHGPTLAHPLVK